MKTDDIEFPVDLDLEMVLGDMPRKVRIPLSEENFVRVTTCLENLEMSGNLTKFPKTVYCKLHNYVHTGI